MQFLSTENIVELHHQLIKRFGGLHGIREMHLLESAIAYPKLLHAIAQEKDPYILAAAYAFHLINNHAFIDGNKRIGTLAMLVFLRHNGIATSIPHKTLYELAIKIATSAITESDTADLLAQYSNHSH